MDDDHKLEGARPPASDGGDRSAPRLVLQYFAQEILIQNDGHSNGLKKERYENGSDDSTTGVPLAIVTRGNQR